MYSGTLIEELMAAVERVEMRARAEHETAELERWYSVPAALAVVNSEPDLLGVA